VLFCDIDRFKDINDERGHAAGDEVLRVVGERISSAIRRDDVAARIGGDELLVILSGVHDLDEAMSVAETIRRAVAEPILLADGRVTTSMSIGATIAGVDEIADDLIARADEAMYEAKRSGRDRVVGR
jgi:diguanylate cyclase (GGDEF)-like protein